MSNIISTNTPGKTRNRLTKAVVISIRELMRQSEHDKKCRDLVAFIILALDGIAETIEKTVAAWEKRNYWVKSDKYRLEWAWASRLSREMHTALKSDDWQLVIKIVVEVAQKLHNIQVSDKHRLGTPWVGAWDELFKKG